MPLDPNPVLPTDPICSTCHGTGRAPARPPINWGPVVNAIVGLLCLVVTSIGARYASTADTKAGDAVVQSEKNAAHIESVDKELKAQRPMMYGKGKE